MITLVFKGTQHTVENGVFTGEFKETLTKLYDLAPVFSSAVKPDRDLSVLDWMGVYLPISVLDNDIDPEKVEPEHVGTMSEWYLREVEKAKEEGVE